MILIDENGKAVMTDVLGLTDTHVVGANFTLPFYHQGNATLIDLPVPADFEPGRYMLVDGVLVPDADKASETKSHDIGLKWEAIKTERDKREGMGVFCNGHWFHSDGTSRIKWLGLKDSARDMQAAGVPMDTVIVQDGDAILWKTMAGTFVPITAQFAFDVVEATKTLDKRLYKVAETHNAMMRASADPAAYDFSTGWPATFKE